MITTNSQTVGFNTDVKGFASTITDWPYDFENILVLGHGGAARAVISVLAHKYPRARFIISGRRHDRLNLFLEAIKNIITGINVSGIARDSISVGLSADVIINTTPLGDLNHKDQTLLPPGFRFDKRPFCYDLIYRPIETTFLRLAAARGCQCRNGLSMLVAQAAESFLLWTGKKVDCVEVESLLSK